MVKDLRYETVKFLIEGGKIQAFSQIFNYLPKTVMGRDLRTSSARMTKLISNPEHFSISDILLVANLIGVESRIVWDLIVADLKNK